MHALHPPARLGPRFTARVQGAEAPFYTTPEEGEEFELEQVGVNKIIFSLFFLVFFMYI